MEEETNNNGGKGLKALLIFILLTILVVVVLLMALVILKPTEDNSVPVANFASTNTTSNNTSSNNVTNTNKNTTNTSSNSTNNITKINQNTMASNDNNSDNNSENKVEIFNHQFTSYINEQTGVKIRSLLSVIASSNEENKKEDNGHIVDVKMSGIQDLKSVYVNDNENIAYMRDKVDANKQYKVTLKYNSETKYITNIDIEEINN